MNKILLVSLFFSLFIWSCQDNTAEDQLVKQASEYKNDVTWEWTELYLEIEKDLAGFRPAPTCRALAYISIAAYESAIPGMPKYKSVSEVLKIPNLPTLDAKTKVNYELAVNVAYKESILELMFSMNKQQQDKVIALYDRLRAEAAKGEPADVVQNSEDWGLRVSKAILAYAETDKEGATQVKNPRPTDYVAPKGDGKWQPTAPDLTRAMFPYWGKVRTFIADENTMKTIPPPTFSTEQSSQYYKDFKEVADAVKQQDYKQVWIAEFWSDDIVGMTFSPPARIMAIGNQLIENKGLNLEQTLHFYLKLGLTLNDASVAAWKGKYEYNVERPVDYITAHIDPNFKPLLGRAINNTGLTPAFPGYPSGHSTFGGAGSIIYEEFFGKVTSFTDNCHKNRTEFYGTPRSFLSFQEMGEENAYSRIPLGVHPRFDCVEGLRLGRVVAEKISKTSFLK